MKGFYNIKKSIIIFFVSFFVFISAGPITAQNGSLFFSPASESFRAGEIFSIDLNLDTTDAFINAAETRLYFPKEKLEALKIKKEGSIFSLWPEEPSFSNETGEVALAGGLPHPGFKGTGKIITIEFRAKEEGEAILTFDESKVLADDGQGTNILIFINSPKYLIYQSKELFEKSESGSIPSIFSSTHPKEEEWYSNNNPSFQWELGADTEGASFILDKNPNSLPETFSQGLVGSKDYSGIKDGTWYFHLRLKTKDGWTGAGHYKVQIDTRPPDPFEIIIDNKGDSTNPSPSLYFETRDTVSGIDKYRIKIGEDEFSDLMTAQIAPKLSPGSYNVIVRAIDKAYNIVRAKTVINIDPIQTPEVNVVPEKYLAGEETLYMEGTALPQVDVIIHLKSGGQEIKTWQTGSNDNGDWFLSTKDLVKPGIYELTVSAQDERGAISGQSEPYKMEVSFSGLVIGEMMMTIKNLIMLLLIVLCFGILLASWYILKTSRTRKALKKEVKEAKDSLLNNFSNLEKEIEKKMELVDAQPGLSEQEKKAYENIRKSLKEAQQSIDKEIKDIEKELK